MNDRIQELMKEAQVIYDYAPFNGDMDRDPKPLYKLDPEKFAELIVRECIDKVTKVSDSIKEFNSDNTDGIDLCDLITYHIKKHFGVES